MEHRVGSEHAVHARERAVIPRLVSESFDRSARARGEWDFRRGAVQVTESSPVLMARARRWHQPLQEATRGLAASIIEESGSVMRELDRETLELLLS